MKNTYSQGKDRYNTEIHCTEFTFLTPRPEGGNPNAGPTNGGEQQTPNPVQEQTQSPDPISKEEDDLPF